MSLDVVCAELAWPTVQDVLEPPGAGPAEHARLAKSKIGASLQQLVGDSKVRVGLLFPDPTSADTEAPVTVVCEFARPVHEGVIQEAHRLAWNFCRAPLLVTIEPHRLRAWSCFEPPRATPQGVTASHAEIRAARGDLTSKVPLADQAAKALNWLNLVSGEFFRQHAHRFRNTGRADRTLLANLRVKPEGTGVSRMAG